ncbi:bifunctional riboflavin kinase/FMN phosphatase, partial [Tanacetum coccineum]
MVNSNSFLEAKWRDRTKHRGHKQHMIDQSDFDVEKFRENFKMKTKIRDVAKNKVLYFLLAKSLAHDSMRFLEAAKRLSIDPSKCQAWLLLKLLKWTWLLVAGSSLPKQSHLYTEATEVINSLLDLRPENWGLPAFEDWIDVTLPLEPWHIGGPVIEGYDRGSKFLGIPTF